VVSLQFSMRDSSIGIAPENQSRIFSGFTQAESSTTRRFGGTGLGLAITQRFVAMMGGELELQSALGQGSRFYFTVTLPIASQNEARERQRMRAHDAGTAWRALVIDDNPTAREVLEQMGQSLGWQVELAESGEQALQLLQQRGAEGIHYQAVFVDWSMPGMDGWQTSQQIRALQDGQFRAGGAADAPVVLMVTAHGREMLSQRSPAEQALLDGYLVKPVTASMLFDAVVDARSEQEQPHPSHAIDAGAQRRLDGMRVLLVEDNLNNQQVASELLAYEGALVQIANHGQEAVEAIAAATPAFDVVLMDLQMPVMDGFSATRVIREDLAMGELPIVAMTANAMASDRAACLAAGMNDHVGKPFDLNHLVQVLRTQAQWGAAAAQPLSAASSLDPGVLQAAALAAVDVTAALQRLGGMQDVYRRMLASFVQDLQAMPEQLRGLVQIAPGDSADLDAKRLLHTLKGLAATLGAMVLSTEAASAEKALAANTGLQQSVHAIDAVCAAIDHAVPGLQGLLHALQQDRQRVGADQGEEGASSQPLDRAALVQALQALLELLQAADMQALAAMADVQQQFGVALGEELSALDEAMADLAFDQALPLCQDLLARFATADEHA
jgi:CheY-like chemotaxis protein